MRNLVSVMLIVLLPLTLASDTQHRFKVYVSVDGDDETTTGLLTSHLKRELRALGDVDIVGWDGDWEFRIAAVYHEIKTKGGVKTGNLSIAHTYQARVPKHFLKDYVHYIKAVYPGFLGAAHWPKDNLQEWCVYAAGNFNDDTLEFERGIRKSQ